MTHLIQVMVIHANLYYYTKSCFYKLDKYTTSTRLTTSENVYADIDQRKYFSFYDYEYCLDVSKQHELMPNEKDMLKGLEEAFMWYKDNLDIVNKKAFAEFIDDTLLTC